MAIALKGDYEISTLKSMNEISECLGLIYEEFFFFSEIRESGKGDAGGGAWAGDSHGNESSK